MLTPMYCLVLGLAAWKTSPREQFYWLDAKHTREAFTPYSEQCSFSDSPMDSIKASCFKAARAMLLDELVMIGMIATVTVLSFSRPL